MKKIKVGLIPAASEGKRMGYLGKILSKSLYPLYDRPIIHHVVENMKGVGINQIYVIVKYQKEKIIEYFKAIENEIGLNINFIEIKDVLGLSNGIMSAKDYFNEPFMVILGDDCTISNSLNNFVTSFFEKNAIAIEGIVREKNKDILSSTCCLKLGKNNIIEEIVEKPKIPISDLRGTGIYVFGNQIFDYIKRTSVMASITDTIGLVAKDRRAYGEFVNGSNININTYDNLLDAWILMKKLRKV